MSNEAKKSFLTGLFSQAQGDRTRGANFMARHNITEEDLNNLTDEQIRLAFADYQKQHADFGVEFTTDYGDFKQNLMANLRVALRMSKHVRK